MNTIYKAYRLTIVARLLLGLVATLLTSQQVLALATLMGDAESGGKLLDERCTACHINMYGDDGSEIYTRPEHSVKTVEGLMLRVEVCNTNTQNGELTADQMDDLTAHLNETYYKFDDE